MHYRFRREEKHDQRGNGHGAQRQNRPIKQDADKNDRDHDERTLRCDLGAGEDEIERRDQQCGERRPFFDRCALAQARDQRQQRSKDEEHHTRDHGHVIAGDREHVADAGHKHRIVKMLRDGVALAGDER